MGFNRLMEMVKQRESVVVVGIDPVIDRFPEDLRDSDASVKEKLIIFGKAVLDGVHDLVPAVKFQSAYFEAYGLEGMVALKELIDYARKKSLFIIADVKRGDIGSTAQAYARAYLEPGSDFEVDALTVNPYLGDDSNNPFYKMAKTHKKGVFVLVKTSNPSSGQFQNLIIDEKPLYKHVAEKIVANEFNDDPEFSLIGAVVGATYPQQIAEMRQVMTNNVFLIPGYGAQGGKGEDLKNAFDEHGLGAIVNSSRGIIYAHEKYGLSIEESSRKAVSVMNEDINKWRI
jgi:orotidine-5'-phosphate decarboxylase